MLVSPKKKIFIIKLNQGHQEIVWNGGIKVFFSKDFFNAIKILEFLCEKKGEKKEFVYTKSTNGTMYISPRGLLEKL